ncbi:hypothetical protein GCM10010193_23270 [Kitasatospora atroaurantiaca]
MREPPVAVEVASAAASSASLSALKLSSRVLVRRVTWFLLSYGLLTVGSSRGLAGVTAARAGTGNYLDEGIDGGLLLRPSGRCGRKGHSTPVPRVSVQQSSKWSRAR